MGDQLADVLSNVPTLYLDSLVGGQLAIVVGGRSVERPRASL